MCILQVQFSEYNSTMQNESKAGDVIEATIVWIRSKCLIFEPLLKLLNFTESLMSLCCLWFPLAYFASMLTLNAWLAASPCSSKDICMTGAGFFCEWNKTSRIDLKTMDLRKMENGPQECLSAGQVATSHVSSRYRNFQQDGDSGNSWSVVSYKFALTELIWKKCFHLSFSTLLMSRPLCTYVWNSQSVRT